MADPISESVEETLNEINNSVDEAAKGCFGVLIFGLMTLVALASGLVIVTHFILD
jgi:hypothetical protein